MAFPCLPLRSCDASRSEELARLVYELLDAHYDTERLVRSCADELRPRELQWRLHLGYLRDLQRFGREVLARQDPNPMIDQLGPRSARVT